MDSFNDQNFFVQVSKYHSNPHISQICNEGYTLKIINTLKSSIKDHFDSMHSAMLHLHKKSIRVPQPMKTINGQTWVLKRVPLLNKEESSDEKNKLCGIHLLTFLPGVPISDVGYSCDIFVQWGLLLAEIHHALKDLKCPSLKEKAIFYDLEYIPDVVNFTDGLSIEKKELVQRVLEKYPSIIQKEMENLPKGFIHGDCNSYNILVQVKGQETETKSYALNGILDFEDVHYGTYIWDVGLMIASALVDCDTVDPFEAAENTLTGYLSRRSLSNSEKSVLKMCIECRICQSCVLCSYSNKLDPLNSYVKKLSSIERKWSILEQLCDMEMDDLTRKWKCLC